MKTIIYYFSGTGNSFSVARDIAEKIHGDLVSIPSVMNFDCIDIDADRVGIVFPSYIAPLVGVPLLLERFVKKIRNIESQKIFAVCTCGGYGCVNALPSLVRLQKIVVECNGHEIEKYSVRMPMNNLEYDHIPIPISRDQDKLIRASRNKIDAICQRIEHGKGTKHRLAKSLFFHLMSPLYSWMRNPIMKDLRVKAKEPNDSKLTFRELMPLTDRSIALDSSCIGCGKCARVCPAANIVITNGRPEFQHRCEVCFACDEWCPQNAIQHWSRAKGVKYHHPDVTRPEVF